MQNFLHFSSYFSCIRRSKLIFHQYTTKIADSSEAIKIHYAGGIRKKHDIAIIINAFHMKLFKNLEMEKSLSGKSVANSIIGNLSSY